MRLEGYGLEPGCNADFVVLQAADPIEAIRLKATRLQVVKRGKVIASTPAKVATLSLAGRPDSVNPAGLRPAKGLEQARSAGGRGWKHGPRD